jgi:sialate O-acetylesterase
MTRYLMIVWVLLCITPAVDANITVPAIFADNMVLQRNTLIPVWGHAAVNEKIEIRFNKQVKTAAG